jgi:hypothetical protein
MSRSRLGIRGRDMVSQPNLAVDCTIPQDYLKTIDAIPNTRLADGAEVPQRGTVK